MSVMLGSWHPPVRVLTGTVVAIATVKVLWTLYTRRKKGGNLPKYEDGIVYIHIFPRGFSKKVVNISPYAIKIETWCRMFKIPYQVVETDQFSPKEKHIPWLVYNGEILADSSVIIECLQDSFNHHDDLSDVEKGITRATCRMLDDTFALLYFYYRYTIKRDEFRKYFKMATIPWFLQSFVSRQMAKNVKKRCLMNGFARYGEDHVINLGKKDIRALANILGNKNYLFGDVPTMVDATVFGHLSQILYPDLSYPWKEYIIKECPQLLDYCTRIKNKYWPDWDSLVDHDTF